MRIQPKWTPEENAFLIANHQKMRVEEIAIAIGRTVQGIKDRKRRLNLRGATPVRKVKEPLQQRECSHCKTTKPIKEFWSTRKKTEKTTTTTQCFDCRNAIRQKQREEMRALDRARGGFLAHNRWTDEEFDYIRNNHKTQTDDEMGLFLKRNGNQVRLKRQAMGLQSCKFLSGISETEEYKEHLKKIRQINQKELDENIEIIRQEVMYLISVMKTISSDTVLECERKLDNLVMENPPNWWYRRVNWKLGQFIELILPDYKFVSVL